MTRISPDVHMHPCHVNCHANVKDHALLCGTGSESLVVLHAYILPHPMNVVNIASACAQAEEAPHRGETRPEMRAREGFRFWVKIDYCGKMWKPIHSNSSI